MRGGLIGILIIGGILYFTDAGSVAWTKLQGLNSNCYSALSSIGQSVANPVCAAVASGFEGLERFGASIGATIDGWKQSVLGNSGLDSFAQDMRDKLTQMTSSQAALSQMMRTGPQMSNSGSLTQQLQQAVDSFTIGQQYLGSSQAPQGITWLQQGAAQPNGFGLMSQLTLGQLYMQGANGVAANPRMAQAYLQQAQASAGLLSTSNTPQAQQLVKALPASPQAIQLQIEQTLRSMRVK